jgi:hypothetical protein
MYTEDGTCERNCHTLHVTNETCTLLSVQIHTRCTLRTRHAHCCRCKYTHVACYERDMHIVVGANTHTRLLFCLSQIMLRVSATSQLHYRRRRTNCFKWNWTQKLRIIRTRAGLKAYSSSIPDSRSFTRTQTNKQTNTLILLYILISTFIYSEVEDGRYWAKC